MGAKADAGRRARGDRRRGGVIGGVVGGWVEPMRWGGTDMAGSGDVDGGERTIRVGLLVALSSIAVGRRSLMRRGELEMA